MFGLSLGEIVIIGICILIFVKPEEFPQLVRTAAKWYGQFLRYSARVRYEIEEWDLMELKKMDANAVSRTPPLDSTEPKHPSLPSQDR
ncbi:MAG: hypothetical protein AAB066_04705 [Candidatus Margulisiibacteriota bacterium]